MKRREFITLVGGATLRPHFLEPTYVQSPKNGSVGCCGHCCVRQQQQTQPKDDDSKD
jgi:hypothetical protein